MVVSPEARWETVVEGSSLESHAAAPSLRYEVTQCRSGTVSVCMFGGRALGPVIQHCKRDRKTTLRKKEIAVEKGHYNSLRQQAALNWHGSYIITRPTGLMLFLQQ